MARSKKSLEIARPRRNRRVRPPLGQALREANERAHQRANRRLGQRRQRTSVHAAIADFADHDLDLPSGTERFLRWVIALSLLPFCLLTSVTFFQVFNVAAQNRQFFTGVPFYFFTLGFVLMALAFFSGLIRSLCLYLYVLGHELTHVIFIYGCRGRVSDFKVGLDGGHVMTNKTNLLIALSPYFVPFWSVLLLIVYTVVRLFVDIPHGEKLLFTGIGLTWGFHMLWTLWMIPRDQPDLKENGTFLSLVIIYLVNLMLLTVFLCLASEDLTWLGFLSDWTNRGAVWLRLALDLAQETIQAIR